MPPPPPPLPLLPNVEPKSESEPNNKLSTFSTQEIEQYVTERISHRNDNSVILSCIRSIQPVLQQGPSCGLVALCMALQLIPNINTSVSEIFDKAIEQKFTKQGEMFSASNMRLLINKLTDKVKAVEVNYLENFNDKEISKKKYKEWRDSVLNSLLQTMPVLFPYDKDYNGEPCMKKGHKAHWAVLSGFILVVKNSNNIQNALKDYKISILSDLSNEKQYYSLNEIDQETILNIISLLDKNEALLEVYVYAQQGKSKYPGIWNLKSLQQSNLNLQEIAPKIQANLGEFVTYDLSNLRGKTIYIT